jgi:16S rRNA (adenine1518-N6/adenine1519-N6)-dimethyltransferase
MISMLSLYAETKKRLAQYNIRPRKRFGQNFLVNASAIDTIITATNPKPSEIILEIGSGTGNITDHLLKSGAIVICVEVDPRLGQILEDRFSSYSTFTLIQGDAARINLPQTNKVIGNLPFSAAAPILFKLAAKKYPFLVLTFQSEFAQKMMALPNSSAYGRLSVMSQLFFSIESLLKLPPKMFYPAPEVVSQVLTLHPRDLPVSMNELAQYQSFITQLFCHRRKLLRKVIHSAAKRAPQSAWDYLATQPYPYSDRRIYSLTQKDLLELFTLFKQKVEPREGTSS